MSLGESFVLLCGLMLLVFVLSLVQQQDAQSHCPGMVLVTPTPEVAHARHLGH